jgi:trehalose-6-phosphate synthase
MKLDFRFVIPLLLILGLLIYATGPDIDALQERWFRRDLTSRAGSIFAQIENELGSMLDRGALNEARQRLIEISIKERMLGVGFCDRSGKQIIKTDLFPPEIKCSEFRTAKGKIDFTRNLPSGRIFVTVADIRHEGAPMGRLIMAHDMSFLSRQTGETKRYIMTALFVLTGIISLFAILLAQLSWRRWMNATQSLVRAFRGDPRQLNIPVTAYTPIVKDLRKLVNDLETRRTARDEANVTWTSRSLKDILHEELSDEPIIVVANREPYIHNRTEKGIEVVRPASGLVTALEPIMESCSGVWIAHGAGSADRDVIDKNGKIPVPPKEPSYWLRPIWLSKEEEQGYYYGFANEGLWPLCHIAHTRPLFRTEDYEYYKQVNERFAQAVVNEAKSDEPVVLIQDYHFALLPGLIRKKLPRAVIVTFWHIPWPNPEVFGICPWREELLEGLLGSSIVGFHTQFHCNNFFDTVDRYLESRIDREQSAISHEGHLTGIKPYPISIEWPPKRSGVQRPVSETREIIRRTLDLPPNIKLGIGVDRLDYTKGIVERFLAVDRLLKLHPQWVGKFSFVQIAAPSRSQIPSYKALHDEVIAVAEQINAKYENGGAKPIILKLQHFEPEDVYTYLRAADVCYVSSLHDGMNLVAKEFVAARDDEQGVLMLSSFTGASRELPEALIVNPYDIDHAAEHMNIALNMSPREQKERMRSMRGLIREFNVYRWAGRMLLDAATIRKRNKFRKRMTGFSQKARERELI